MKSAFVSCIALAVAMPLAAQETKPFEAADLYRLSMVQEPVVAPDGARVAFSRTAFDIGTDRRTREIWLATLDAKGVADQRLIAPGARSSALWSPDGSRLAWTGDVAGKPQLFVMTVAEGVARAITSGKLAPEGAVWSPDGTRLAFTAQVDAAPAKLAGMPTKPEGAVWAPEPRVTSAFRYRSNEGGYRAAGYRHIFVVDATGGEPRQVTRGDIDHVDPQGSVVWTRDGRALIAVANRRADADLRGREADLWLVPLDGEARQLTTADGVEREPQVSPDGKSIAYTGTPETPDFYVQDDLWVMPAGGGAARNLTSGRNNGAITTSSSGHR